jgi:hypothetical protein
MFWNVVVLGTLGVTLLLIGLYVVVIQRPGPLPDEKVIPDEGKAVVADGSPLPEYRNYPPSSGTHYGTPARWGISDTPVSEGNYLNNLARGGVVILYKCDAQCDERKQQLAAVVAKAPKDSQFNAVKILVSPYERMTAPVTLLAWGYQLNLETVDEQTLLTWYRRFVNHGPTNGP